MGERARSQLSTSALLISCPKLPISRVFAAVSQGLGSLHNDGDPSLRSPVTGSDPFTGKIEEHHTDHNSYSTCVELHRQVAEQMYTKLVHHDTPRYTMYSVDTDVHQPSTLCRDLGVNLGLSFGGPCLGH